MDPILVWTSFIVGATFLLYIGIAIYSRAGNTSEFFIAGKGVSPLANGMATAADWMSAASFISMAGLISFSGRDGSKFLMGWTGGYVLLALLLAPYLRKFGKFTVPDFVGDRYYSGTARVVAVICAIFVSFTYVCGQMRGVGIVFSRFLEIDVNTGVIVGMFIVFLYAVMGGMKGITYTQVAQFCVLIFAFMVPAIFISIQIANNPIPQIGMGGEFKETGVFLLDKLDGLSTELGFSAYTSGTMSTLDLFCVTAALMLGTAGLPHVIVRFYTVKRVKDARMSAFWALFFIAILYTAAPAVAVFARTNFLESIPGKSYTEAPTWFKNWEKTGLVAWQDKQKEGEEGYGVMHYGPGAPFELAEGQTTLSPVFPLDDKRGTHGERIVTNTPTSVANEVYVDKDIMVLANPEIAKLPNWVVALVAAGGLAAALSTAAGLLLVISTAFAHDLVKRTFKPDLSDEKELKLARFGAAAAVMVAGIFGIFPPGFVAEVVAFAFSLAAASFFPVILLGIFWKRATREGAVAGMIVGIVFTALYIVYFKFGLPFVGKGTPAQYFFADADGKGGISPEGIGTIGMTLNFIVMFVVSAFTPKPPQDVVDLVERIRLPGE